MPWSLLVSWRTDPWRDLVKGLAHVQQSCLTLAELRLLVMVTLGHNDLKLASLGGVLEEPLHRPDQSEARMIIIDQSEESMSIIDQ